MKKNKNKLINQPPTMPTSKPLNHRVAKFLRKLEQLKLEKNKTKNPIMTFESRHEQPVFREEKRVDLFFPHIIPLQHFDFDF